LGSSIASHAQAAAHARATRLEAGGDRRDVLDEGRPRGPFPARAPLTRSASSPTPAKPASPPP